MQANVKHTIGFVLSLAFVGATAGCGETLRPAATTPDFTGTWIGVSRVISCEGSGGGCANYPVGHERYLDFRLTQHGDEVSGNLSPTKGGPTALPAVFWISGRVASGRLTFQPMEVTGASGGLTSFDGEVMLTAISSTEMVGRMTERATHTGDQHTITWDVRTSRR